MRQNITDSILFLHSAREAIKLAVQESDVKNKNDVCNFVMKEATDYEVMALVMEGTLPTEKFNKEKEIELWNRMQEQINTHWDSLTEHIDSIVLMDVLFELGPVSVHGLSSSKIVLEHMINISDAETWDDLSNKKKDDFEKRYGVGKYTTSARVSRAIKKKYKSAVDNYSSGLEILDKKVFKKKHEIRALKAKVQTGKIDKAKANRMINTKNEEIKKQLLKRASIKQNMKDLVKNIKTKAVKTVGDVKSGKTKADLIAKVKGNDTAMNVAKNLGGWPGVIGATLAASLLIYGSVKAYKRLFSKAAKACGDKSGKVKTLCMKKFKIDSLTAQFRDLNAAMSVCSKSKNPGKCGKTVGRKLGKIKAQLAKVKR